MTGRAAVPNYSLERLTDETDMTSWLRAFFVIAALAVPVGGAQAAGAVDTLKLGPKIGSQIPHNLKVRDQNNKYQDFMSLARKRGLIVLFSRSLDW